MSRKTVEVRDEPALDVKAVSRLLGMSATFVYRAVERGELPCYKLGGRLRFDPDEVRAFKRAHARELEE